MPRPASPSSARRSAPLFDRSGAERDDEHLLSRVLAEPATRVLAVRRDAAPILEGGLALVGADAFRRSSAAGADDQGPAVPVTPAGSSALAGPADGVDTAARADGTARAVSADRVGALAPVEGSVLADGRDTAAPAVTARAVSADGTGTVAPAEDSLPDAPGAATDTAATAVTQWAFLGRDDTGAAVVLAVLVDDAPDDLVPNAAWVPLRAAGGDLPQVEAEMLTTAVALAGWLRDAPFCPACGTLTEVRHSGWSRHCPACGREHFPRTDPAVIVLVTSAESEDRVLLGANAAWGGQRYSCFAGFAEAGESLEDAVVREVAEEAGVSLRDIAYRGSQAWPYPRSLMLGFRAEVVDDGAARPDGDEIVEVRWFTRDEIGAALRGDSDVHLPGAASIARRLIDEWYRGVA